MFGAFRIALQTTGADCRDIGVLMADVENSVLRDKTSQWRQLRSLELLRPAQRCRLNLQHRRLIFRRYRQ
jgi:hypothetical protein